MECSYSTFTRYVPDNICKPKAEDWGTCLCMKYLNPELKLEGLWRAQPELYKTKEQLILYSDDEVIRFIDFGEKSKESFEYLEWQHVKSGEKSTTYISLKTPLKASAAIFAHALSGDIVEYALTQTEWYYNSSI